MSELQSNREVKYEINGKIPLDLHGTLFRIGPALVDRQGGIKNSLIEGDGYVHSIQLNANNNQVILLKKFIETEKFINENSANSFLYRTIATKAPRFYNNFGFNLANLANINLIVWNKKLLASDEMQLLFELDLNNLNSQGELQNSVKVMAHGKWCQWNKEHIFPSIDFFPNTKVKFLILKNNGQQELTKEVQLQKCGYIHDWFMTKNHFIFVLPPLFLELKKIIPLGLGLVTHAETLFFDHNKKNRIVVIDRNSLEKVFEGEAVANWFWHSINSFETDNKIYLDAAVTKFEILNNNSSLQASKLWSYKIDLTNKNIQEEPLIESKTIEFPTVEQDEFGIKKDMCWFVSNTNESKNLNQLCSYNYKNKKLVVHNFATNINLMSPIVVKSKENNIYILVEAYSEITHTNSLYILKNDLERMVIQSEIHFDCKIPFSFHGCWQFGS